MDNLVKPRNSFMALGKIYFWTATIRHWNQLLLPDSFKDVIISSIIYLDQRNLIDVYAFVLMPNHIHVIWRMNKMNGKETPRASLLKYTAHQFKTMLSAEELIKYKVNAANKQFEFWQRDPLAIELYTSRVAYQKLNYIHFNPMAKGWSLVSDPSDYIYSSAAFYEKDEHRFDFLNHLGDEF